MPDTCAQFDAIDQAWTLIQGAFPDAYTNATPGQKGSVEAVRDMARDAWYGALNKLFHDGDPAVQELSRDLADENDQMAADLDALKDVVRFLDLAKSAAKTAAALAALAA